MFDTKEQMTNNNLKLQIVAFISEDYRDYLKRNERLPIMMSRSVNYKGSVQDDDENKMYESSMIIIMT